MKEHHNISKRNAAIQLERILMNFDAAPEANFSNDEVKVLLNKLHQIRQQQELHTIKLKNSYELLVEKRKKFISLYDLTPIACFTLDALGMITVTNQHGADLLKIPKERALYQRFQSFILADSWEDFNLFLQQAAQSPERQTAEMKLYLGNNEITYVKMEGIAVHGATEEQIKYCVAVIDVTESKKSELSLQRNKERLQMSITGSNVGIWNIDHVDQKMYLDDYSYAILSLNPSQFDESVSSIIQHLHPDDQEKMRYHMARVIGFHEFIDVEFRVFSETGQLKYISFKGHEVNNFKKEGKCFAGILMDVTEAKRLAEEARAFLSNQQKLILEATIMAQEKERAEISSTLHDSICQILYGIRLNLQSFQI
uniref:PAS domain-containing protein n=1 Tax=Pedobacter sp. TaxID=1411316 RepID=UPI003D7F8570